MQRQFKYIISFFFTAFIYFNTMYAAAFTYTFTHDDLNRVERVELDTGQQADYYYRQNGQLSRSYLQGSGPQPENPPTANFTVTPEIGGETDDIHQFDASTSTDPNDPTEDILVRWDFNGDEIWDTPFDFDKQVSHQFTNPGDYEIRLEVKDTDGNSAIKEKTIRVFDPGINNQPPQPVITASAGNTVLVNMEIIFSASQSSDPDGEVVWYEWDMGDGRTEDCNDWCVTNYRHTYTQTGNYTILLTVTDDRGETATITRNISVVEDIPSQPPVISTGQTAFTVNQDESLSVFLDVTDADTPPGDLVVTAEGQGITGAYVRYNGLQYTFEWQPSGNISGDFNIDLAVTDPEGYSDTHSITVHVNAVSDPPVEQWKFENIGSLDVGNDAYAIDLETGYAYLSTSSDKKLVSVNITNPANPTKLSEVDTYGNAKYLDLESNRIYVAAYNDGIQIFSRGSNPSRYGEFDPYGSGRFIRVAAAGTTVFGMNESGNLYVINASNPSNPTQYGANPISTGMTWNYLPMATWNGLGYLYIATPSGVMIVNYSNPSSASLVGTPVTGDVRGVYIPQGQNTLYVSVDSEVRVYNISNRTSPSLIASGNVGKYGANILTADSNGLIFARDRMTNRYIYLLEVNGSNITEKASYETNASVHSMKTRNGYLYAEYNETLNVFSYENALNNSPTAYNQTVTTSAGQPVSITLTGYDKDGNSLEYSIVDYSVYRGALTGTPPNVTFSSSALGQGSFQFRVNDGFTDSSPGTVVINVTDPSDPPVFNDPLPPVSPTVDEGDILSFEVLASDPDFGDTVTETAGNLPTGATFENGIFAWAPESGQSQSSPYSITFTATDSTDRTATLTVSITVNHVNELPVIAQFAANPTSGKAPLPVDFTVQADDSDGTISSIVISYGDGEQGTDLNHVYSAGNYTATLTVTDNEGGQATRDISISVQPPQHGNLQFTGAQYNVMENTGVFSLEITRTGGSDGAVSVLCSSSNGTAMAGTDYTAVSQTLNWNNNDTTPKVCTIPIINDDKAESSETLTLAISTPAGGVSLGTVTSVQLTIENDDVQGIQLDRETLAVPEGGSASFRVSLSAQPDADIIVNLTRTGGDTDINVQTGTSLTFTPANWSQEQTVILTAGEDDDAYQGQAVIQAAAFGLTSRTLAVNEGENDSLEIETDIQSVEITEGETSVLQLRLTALPQASVAVSVTHHAGDPDIRIQSGASLSFAPQNWNVYQAVTLNAVPDSDDTDGIATINISADGITTVSVTVYEREPVQEDSDGDGIPDALENTSCSDPSDADTDDDGIQDGYEDVNYNGIVDDEETSPCQADTDGDGIQDGTELSFTVDEVGPDTDTGIFQPDLDPTTQTDPLTPDTDGGSLTDGQEDMNCNGRIDDGESDPNDPADDSDLLAVDYGANGTFTYNGTLWTNISGWDPENISAWNNKLVADYGSDGTFIYDGTSWLNISGLDPENITAWNDKLVADYGPDGTFVYDGTAWLNISGLDPENITAWNDKLAADYGSYGTFIYDGASWQNISSLDPENITAWGDRLVVDYGPDGTFVYEGTVWTNISGLNPDSITVWGDKLAADYGTYGTFIYDGVSWQNISNLDPENMISWGNELVVDYGADGTFIYDGAVWTNISGLNPDSITAWGDELAVDYGTYGTFIYDGASWLPVSNWNPEGMTTF